MSPADYPETLAVANSTVARIPWKGSSRGDAVAITAPGTDVWRADFDDQAEPGIDAGTGTTYATTHVAGVAALWRAKRRAELATLTPSEVPRLFAHLVEKTATLWPDEDLKADWGEGILDAGALLNEPVVGQGAPTAEEVAETFEKAKRASASEIVSTSAIVAGLFTGEGTGGVRFKIVNGARKLLGLLGAETSLGKTFSAQDESDEAVAALVQTEATHYYRTDKAFRESFDTLASRTAIPASVTDQLRAVLEAPERDRGAGYSTALWRALRGQATVRGRYRWIGLALVILALAVAVAAGLWAEPVDLLGLTVTGGVLIAAFYVAAQAIERSVEFTFGRVVFKDNPDRTTERALILLGISIVLGCIVSALTGLRLLEALAGEDARGIADGTLVRATGVLVTGLAIGGGTKPLHDLLTRIRTTTDAAKAPLTGLLTGGS